MKALLLIAHGSRSQTANEEIHSLAASLSAAQKDFDLVAHAFLEMAEPNIIAGGEKLIAAGATEIVALPYFLAAGKHVSQDVPTEIATLQKQNPSVTIHTAGYFGSADGLLAAIQNHLRATQ